MKRMFLACCLVFSSAAVSFASSEITVTGEDAVRQQTAAGGKSDDAMITVQYVSPIFAKTPGNDPKVEPYSLTVKSRVTASDLVSLLDLQAHLTDIAVHDGVDGLPQTYEKSGLARAFEPFYHNTLDRVGLCNGSPTDYMSAFRQTNTSTLTTRLVDCANYAPNEYSAAVSIFESLNAWRTKEMQGAIAAIASKLRSSALKDRLETRLITNCINDQLVTDAASTQTSYPGVDDGLVRAGDGAMMPDMAVVLSRCSNPANWNLTNLFTLPDLSTCSASFTGGTSAGLTVSPTNSEYVFDYSVFIRGCVVTERTSAVSSTTGSTELSYGAEVAIGLLPYTKVLLNRSDRTVSLKLQTYPMAYSPAEVYDALYLRAYNLVSSKAFTDMKTRGCIPSPFAPTDFSTLVETPNSGWEQYCSIWIPAKAIQQLGDEKLSDDIQFFWSILARRIAVIQALEILRGSEIIARESLRFFKTADQELYDLIAPSAQFIEDAGKLYHDSLQLSYSTTLEDLVQTASSYTSARTALQQGVEAARNQSARRFSTSDSD